MYSLYLNKILLPVTPKSLSISYNNKNTTMTLINEGEINILKEYGLETIKFDAELPNQEYHYARYLSGFQNAEYYQKQFDKIIKSKKPFKFVLIRETENGNRLENTNIKVAFEGNIQYKESKENGIDLIASITLKRYKDYGLKTYTIQTSQSTVIGFSETQRTTENSPLPTQSTTYTVKSGDSLWKIAKYFYGDGSQYNSIFEANQDKISNPSLIYPGQVLVIPKT